MSGAPQNSDEVAAAISPTLDLFVANAAPALRKTADALYEELLYSVQDYLRQNAEWNIGNEIDRCRTIEADNRYLRVANKRLLEALQDLVNSRETQPPKHLWDAARYAIAKATEPAQ